MKESSAWKLLCIVLMFCAAAVIDSPAQTFTTLYQFCSQPNCADGVHPLAGLIQASDGNFYGTTQEGGANGPDYGTVFKITPAGTLTTLYSFCPQSNCGGVLPRAALVQGADGNFYGTTTQGGSNGYGTVFKITAEGALTTLHSFTGSDGRDSIAGLVQASDGNFYGTTSQGGADGYGTVFSITPGGTLTILHSFTGFFD